MNLSMESNYTNSLTGNYELNRSLRFWLFLIFDVSAILCNIFVLYHLLAKRRSRKALHNHGTILILLIAFIYQLIDIPLHLQVLSTGIVRPTAPALCLIWLYIDWGFFFLIYVLLAFVSFERHILIFHCQLVTTKKNRWIFHYIPLLTIVISVLLFYIIAIFAPICENIFDYTSDLCGNYACYSSIKFFMMFEQVGLGAVPVFSIIIFNLTLLIRIIWQKYRIHRSPQWKKQRILAIQIFLMSIPYLVFCSPPLLIFMIRIGLMNFYQSIFFSHTLSFFTLSFVCLGGLPKFWKKLNRIHPR